MKILFHVGWNKAGSTTIQESLAASATALARKGIYYPRPDGAVSHTRLLFADAADEEFTRFYGRTTAAGRHASRVRALEMWQSIEREIERTRPTLMILSTEFGVGLRRVSWLRLAERLHRLARAVDMVVYVRSPVAHYLSAVQQGVKFGERIKDPTKRLRYKAEIRKVQGLRLGEVVVRPYDRGAFPDECICQDFVRNVAKLDPETAALVDVSTANATLSVESMAVMHAFNRTLFPREVRSGRPLGDDLVQALKRAEMGGGYSLPKLKESVRTLIENDLQRDLAWLRETLDVTFPDFPYDRVAAESSVVADLRNRHDRLELADVVDVDPAGVTRLEQALLDDLKVNGRQWGWKRVRYELGRLLRGEPKMGTKDYYRACAALLPGARCGPARR